MTGTAEDGPAASVRNAPVLTFSFVFPGPKAAPTRKACGQLVRLKKTDDEAKTLASFGFQPGDALVIDFKDAHKSTSFIFSGA